MSSIRTLAHIGYTTEACDNMAVVGINDRHVNYATAKGDVGALTRTLVAVWGKYNICYVLKDK